MDVHIRGSRLQPGTDPKPGHGKCWREGMRSSVSTRAGKAQEGTYTLEKATDLYSHCSVGHSQIQLLT
jgi:hypothetical protein